MSGLHGGSPPTDERDKDPADVTEQDWLAEPARILVAVARLRLASLCALG
jgi:hypothetical protein